MTMGLGEIMFFLLGTVAIAAALGVILHPHPVYSALNLVIALFQIAGLFILLDAQMVAFLQVIVYAGAIMVLFLFVIMLLNLDHQPEPPPLAWRVGMLSIGGVLAAELAVFFLWRVPAVVGPEPALDPLFGTAKALAKKLFTDHVFSFEITSVLLLIAVVGAVVLANKEEKK
jgi:NADH-quinone oxidoreductase subunit J